MGFYVDTAEMKKALEGYQKISKKTQSQLVTAKISMNGIINSNAMHGQVGQAIAADINNNQNAVIVGLKNSYSALEMELRQACQEFKSTTGESSDAAVLSEEVLIKAKSEIDQLKQTYQEQVTNLQSVYSSISDLISLSAPKSNFIEVSDAAKKYVDEIIKKVNQFDSKQGNSANEDMIQSLGTQIKAAEKVGSLSYKDPQFLAFVNSTALADNVQAFQKNVTEAEEKQQQTKEKDLNLMTPSEMIAKYGVDDPDVKKRINDINQGISTTVIGVTNDLVKETEISLFIEGSQQFFDKNSQIIANMSNYYSSDFAGNGLGSALYLGGKVGGKVNKAIPFIGPAIDAYSLISSEDPNAQIKFAGHLAGNAVGDIAGVAVATVTAASVAGTIGGVLGTAIPVPVVGTVIGVIVGTIVGTAINTVSDAIIDSASSIVK